MSKKKENDNIIKKIKKLSDDIDSVGSTSTNSDDESYEYRNNIYKLLINTKAKPSVDDTILQKFLRFLVLGVIQILIGVFAFCIIFYIMVYTFATIFSCFNWIDIKIMENTMAKFIHSISLLSGWILYLVDKFSKSNGK